ncbi:MAG: signal peptidase I, partial [Anaerolineales bacterium]
MNPEGHLTPSEQSTPAPGGQRAEEPITPPQAPSAAADNAIATEDAPPAPGGWAVAGAIIREVVETVVLALVMVFLIQLVIRNFRVDGHSMQPNLNHGQYLVVDKLSYNLPFNIRPPRRGDVIVFAPPSQPDKDFVKRIIGLPGDTVEIKRGQVFINSRPLPNTFGAKLDQSSMAPKTVPPRKL